jgi:hypothetical protein
VGDGTTWRATLIVTVYRGARSKTPADVADLDWSDLADELEALANEPTKAPADADPAEQKRQLVAWSPHDLSVPYCTAANVRAVTALVLDVDHGDPSDVAARLDAEQLAGFLYESPTSTDEHRKFRVVVPTTATIDPASCRSTRIALAEALGLEPGCGVEETGDPSRIFFAGRLHGTRERETWRVDGDALDVAVLPPIRLAWGASKQAAAKTLTPLAELPPADAGIAAALGPWSDHDGRKWDLCGAVGGVMRKLGFTAKQCEAELRAWLDGAEEHDVDVTAGVAWALNAWDLDPKRRYQVGPCLSETIGAEHAAIVERAACLGRTWLPKPVAGDRGG